jgi:hypothetical protein
MCNLMLLILFMAILLFTILTFATDHPLTATSKTRLGSSISPSSAMLIINGINTLGKIREVSAQSTENASTTALTSGIGGTNNQPDNGGGGSSSNITTATTTIPAPLIDMSPSQRTALAFAISFITILVITLVVSKIVGNARRSHPNIKTGFWDIIREGDWYPSLAIFQFLVWTFVITFAFLGIYLVRIFGGVLEAPPSIPTNILALMGISVAVPIVSGGISRIKYFSSTVTAVKQPPSPLPPLSTMLEENNKPALTRFQMFGWTWIGIMIYIGILFSTVGTTLMDIQDARTCQTLRPNQAEFSRLHCDEPLTGLTLPDIDPTLVILMGLSQGAYLGGKIITVPTMKIDKVVLAKKDSNEYVLSIFGNNFGQNKDTVWFDDIQIRGDKLSVWDDSRIDASLGAISLVQDTLHKVRVAKGSLIEEKTYSYRNNELV